MPTLSRTVSIMTRKNVKQKTHIYRIYRLCVRVKNSNWIGVCYVIYHFHFTFIHHQKPYIFAVCVDFFVRSFNEWAAHSTSGWDFYNFIQLTVINFSSLNIFLFNIFRALGLCVLFVLSQSKKKRVKKNLASFTCRRSNWRWIYCYHTIAVNSVFKVKEHFGAAAMPRRLNLAEAMRLKGPRK